jgi:hypothetical protein
MIAKKRVLAGVGAAAGLVLIGAAVPRAARAIYTTPVTVYNTSAQPVDGVDVEKLARIPYQSNIINGNCSGVQNCQFSGFTPCPAGYRLVVENVSGFMNLTMDSPPIAGYLENFDLPHQNFWGLSAPTGGTGFNGESFAGLNQNVHAIFDVGESPFIVIYGKFMGVGFNNAVNVSGYLENCSITGCPAVQH